MNGRTDERVNMIMPRRCGEGGDDDEAQEAVIWCRIVKELIRGERRRWRIITVVSSGMKFVRDLVLEMRCEGMPQKGASGRCRKERQVYGC